MAAKKEVVRGVLSKVSSQRVQYKPYSYEMDFSGGWSDEAGMKVVIVEFSIPAEHVVERGDDYLVVSLDGFNAIVQELADSVDKLNDEYMDKLQKGNQ